MIGTLVWVSYTNSNTISGYRAEALQPIEPLPEVIPVLEPKPQKLAINTIIGQYDWNQEIAYKIMFCESSGNPKVYNPEQHKGCKGSLGLFQIACVHSKYVNELSDFYDVETNVAVAYKIYQLEGWKPWGCFKKI